MLPRRPLRRRATAPPVLPSFGRVLKRSSKTTGAVMDLAGYGDVLSRDRDTVIKLNLSWTKYFPACSSQPWQVDGVVTKMLGDGFEQRRLNPVENKTLVTSPREGCRNNRWEPVLTRHGLTFTPADRSRVASLSVQEPSAEIE